MSSVTINWDGHEIVSILVSAERRAIAMHWTEANELARRIVHGTDGRETIGQRVSIRRDPKWITLVDLLSPLTIGPMPLEAAAQIAAAIRAKVAEAEEVARAWEIIRDNVLLVQSGAPFGLSGHRTIQRETLQEAACRAGGIHPRSIVGVPSIIQGPPQ